jgi:Uma2 family endonuclease
MSLVTQRKPAALADLLALPEEDRYELVSGELVPKDAASGKHAGVQLRLGRSLGPFDRRPGGPPNRPGGWWFASEALVQLAPGQVRRPDLAGWRRERLSELPAEVPVTVVPDWICEILSPSNASNDSVRKMRLYHACQVSHYWLVDPMGETLSVYRYTPEGYLQVLLAERGERIRAEPFAAVELPVGVLFGDDEE